MALVIRFTRQPVKQSRIMTLLAVQKLVFYFILLRQLQVLFRNIRARGLFSSVKDVYTSIATSVFKLIMRWPSVKAKVDTELAKTRLELKDKLVANVPSIRNLSLPDQGRTLDEIEHDLDTLASLKGSETFKEGKVSGAVYWGNEGIAADAARLAVNKFFISNPLHPDIFPGVQKMEAELVQMVLDVYHAGPEGAGTTTSGGTESLLMACKTYRDWARATKGITKPEIVMPVSAHVALDKAAHYFGIKLRKIPVDPITRKVDLKAVRRAINGNTIALVGSAPNFPDGMIDDITGLGLLAKKYKIGLHVDCCLGSFLVPFLDEAGFQTEPFDFRVDGVTSISCDVHKYGFTVKGVSTILYKNSELRSYQYFTETTWPGGAYASPTIAGSRSGAVLASAWSTLIAVGRQGYVQACRDIVGAAKAIEAGLVREVPEVQILGKPLVSVIAFKSDVVDIYEVGDRLSKKGWHLNALQNPPALHICCTKLTIPRVDDLVSDVKNAVRDVLENPTSSKGNNTTIYGLGSSNPAGPGLVTEVLKIFLDTLYRT